MLKNKIRLFFKTFLCFFIATLLTSPVSAVSDSYQQSAALNGSYWYNPSGSLSNCLPGGGLSAGVVAGNSNAEKIWNFFVTAGITGVSDNPAVIAGILGNLQQESHLDPFIRNSSGYTGLAQWRTGRNEAIINQINQSIGGQYWHESGSSSAPEDAVDQAIQIQLSFLIQEARFKNYFVANLDKVDYRTGAEGAESYSDLFLVGVEGAVGSSKDQTLKDSFVIQLAQNSYRHDEHYQGASSRRSNAASFFNQYGNDFQAIESSNTSQSNNGANVLIIGDSITVRSENNLKTIMPNVTINAAVSRRFDSQSASYQGSSVTGGLEVLQNTSLDNVDILVYALGTNNGGTQQDAEEVIRIATEGRDRKVIFMTPFSLDQSQNNGYAQFRMLLKSLKDSNPNTVFIADWNTTITNALAQASNSKDYMDDNVHPTIGKGTELFAQTIYSAVTNRNLQTLINSPNVCTPNSIAIGDIPDYYQYDKQWNGANYFGGYSIAGYGCGPTSFAMMATALLGRTITPIDAATAGSAYATPAGSAWGITEYLAGVYDLEYQNFSTNESNCAAVINQALDDGWMIHVTGSGGPPYWGCGHYIGITSRDPVTQQWYIVDSAVKNGNKYYDQNTVLTASGKKGVSTAGQCTYATYRGTNCGNLRGIRAKR